MSSRRILICSSALLTPSGDISNVGDEALTEVLMRAVADRTGAETYATLHAARESDLVLPDHRVPVRPLRRLAAEIRAADLVIAGGGTLLQEDSVPRFFEPTSGLLRYVASIALLARVYRKPFMLAGVGAEGLATARACRTVRFICRSAAAVTVRDSESARLLQSISGRTPVLAADPMFLEALPQQPAAIARVPNRLFVNLTPSAPTSLLISLAAAVRTLAERGSRITLVPMDRRSDASGDSSTLRDFARIVAHPNVEFVQPGLGWRELLALFAQADLCVGMRLHFMIFASLSKRPLVALTSLPKTRAFVADLGITSLPTSLDFLSTDALVRAAGVAAPAQLRMLAARAERTLDCVATLCA